MFILLIAFTLLGLILMSVINMLNENMEGVITYLSVFIVILALLAIVYISSAMWIYDMLSSSLEEMRHVLK